MVSKTDATNNLRCENFKSNAGAKRALFKSVKDVEGVSGTVNTKRHLHSNLIVIYL